MSWSKELNARLVCQFAALLALTVAASSVAPVGAEEAVTSGKGSRASIDQTSASTMTLSAPRLVVTVRAQGSNRFGILYWEGAQPLRSLDVLRDGRRIARVSGSTTGNGLYTDAVKALRGTFTYKVCYAGTTTCSNSITVVYSSSTETIRYAPECPTTGTATCVVTRS